MQYRSEPLSRRGLLARCAAAGVAVGAGIGLRPRRLQAETAPLDPAALVAQIQDDEIRAGMEAAILRNLLPAATERVFPGHFTINADGGGFGSDTIWPGLDSWQMAGAYLLLGRTRLVTDYFDFVRAAQRKDGNIPFAVFPGDTPPGGCLRGLKSPQDIFSYTPPRREGAAPASLETRRWIGLFEHWQTQGFPLGALATICYLLTADEIFAATHDQAWLSARLASVESAGQYLLSIRKDHGLMGGSGFYIEAPPREGYDGTTQCYACHAFRALARLCRAAGATDQAATWNGHADALAKAFMENFWRGDHFGEYVHPTHGLVDTHGLSDVNWAAVAFGLVTGAQAERVWQRLMAEPDFWRGGMPTQLVTQPFGYEEWELRKSPECPVSPINDVAAMGRVWQLEALACQRMKANPRLVDSVRKVCRAAKADGFWRERYHPRADGTVVPAGSEKYCEYPAVLIRVVLGNRQLFLR